MATSLHFPSRAATLLIVRVALATLATLPVLTACSQGASEASPTTTAAPTTSSPAPTSSAAPTMDAENPAAAAVSPSQAPNGPTTPATASGQTCGTVGAASGLTLQVMVGEEIGCPEAIQLVSDFQRKIAGRQSPGSTEPVAETMGEWFCVSGPPSAHGGTTCTRQDTNVLAPVAPLE